MNNIVIRLRREPLVWFLLAGLALFGVNALVNPAEDPGSSRVIEVDREKLLEFMQLRARSFNERAATQFLEQMQPQEVAGLVEELVREEALYREGLRLGLDRNDYVMRRRLVQSVEYLAQSSEVQVKAPDEVALKRYYQSHRHRYVDAPSISFSHRFFSAGAQGWNAAQSRAIRALDELNSSKREVSSDRFLYLQDYTGRNPQIIEGHFGQDFARQVFAMDPQDGRWQGPLRSKHGFHIVQVTKRNPGRPLSFVQARAMVAADAMKDAREARKEAFAKGLLTQFDVDINSDVQELMAR